MEKQPVYTMASVFDTHQDTLTIHMEVNMSSKTVAVAPQRVQCLPFKTVQKTEMSGFV